VGEDITINFRVFVIEDIFQGRHGTNDVCWETQHDYDHYLNQSVPQSSLKWCEVSVFPDDVCWLRCFLNFNCLFKETSLRAVVVISSSVDTFFTLKSYKHRNGCLLFVKKWDFVPFWLFFQFLKNFCI
jgi:hypothetical protein